MNGDQVEFTLQILGPEKWDPKNDNVDVVVTFPDDSRFTATFFTLQNILALFKKNKETGECRSGLYLWAVDMILVEELTVAVIQGTVEGLLQDGEFHSAFSRTD